MKIEREECHAPCDVMCSYEQECESGIICIAFPILFIVLYALWGILAGVRLVQFFKYSVSYKWNLKKLLYLFGVLTAVIRVIR